MCELAATDDILSVVLVEYITIIMTMITTTNPLPENLHAHESNTWTLTLKSFLGQYHQLGRSVPVQGAQPHTTERVPVSSLDSGRSDR